MKTKQLTLRIEQYQYDAVIAKKEQINEIGGIDLNTSDVLRMIIGDWVAKQAETNPDNGTQEADDATS